MRIKCRLCGDYIEAEGNWIEEAMAHIFQNHYELIEAIISGFFEKEFDDEENG